MKTKYLILAILIGLFSITEINAQKNNNAYLYNSEEIKCSISFPIEFANNVSKDDISTLYKASCKTEGMLFLVNVRIYDLDAETEKIIEEQKEEYLQATLENFNKNLDGDILITVKTTNSGVDGKIATIDVGGNKVFYSVYIQGKREYQVVVLELETGSFNDRMINSFKNSFKILQ